jgi:hypothetical protein
MMDEDLDYTFSPSGTIYGARAIKLDPATQGCCYLGSRNSMCVGITPQQSEFAPGAAPLSVSGVTAPPFILAQVGDNSNVPVYGPGRRCLIDIDPNFGGQIKPNDLVISGDSGYGTKASPTGAWNQWIIGISLSFANSGQSCNVKVVIFPWSPTGS